MRVNWILQAVALPTWANDELIPKPELTAFLGGSFTKSPSFGVTSAIQ